MRRFLCVALLLGAWVGAASADIAYPARLDVVETESGVYEIIFTLPIVEGRKLRAQPAMPPTCTEIGERQEGASAGGYTATWSVRCEPGSLAGEAILVQGLLGTQTDLAFTLTTLDGRSYSRILRPSRPGFLVPDPPPFGGLVVHAGLAGLRRTLRSIGFWLIFLLAAAQGGRVRPLVFAAGTFAAGHLLAQWLGGAGWLEVAPQMRDIILWSTIAVPAIGLAVGDKGWKGWLRPLWPMALLLGLLFGGARPEALPPEGLSTVEQFAALLLFSLGAGLACLLMVAAGREFVVITELTGGGHWLHKINRFAGYLIGSLSVGMLIAQLVGLWVSEPPGFEASLPLVLLAAILGPTLVFAGRDDRFFIGVMAVLAAVGVSLGLAQVDWPALSLLALGTVLFLGVGLALNRPIPVRWVLAVVAVAVPSHLWSTSLNLAANVSRSTAVAGGAALIGLTVVWISIGLAREGAGDEKSTTLRLMGAGVAIVAVLWRLTEYRVWFEREVATEAALGFARLPLLSLVLVVLGFVLWPRRKWDDQREGVDRRLVVRHLAVFGAAFLLVPLGTLSVRNPFFEASAPRGESARLIMSRVLSDTYFAFNLSDEDELYDALAESVTGELVSDIYLDNRRRLTAGVREGTKVTVRDVGVVEIGDPREGSVDDLGFSYDVVWSVVARVQHLQHVHHRKNTYGGVLTLEPVDNRWLLSGVELLSEDRVVVPWDPT